MLNKKFLAIENLYFGYDRRKWICKGLFCEIEEDEILGIMGPSGCGKSTLLRLISGFLTPDKGHILLNGESILEMPPQLRPTSMVFQNYALFPYMSVRENIGFGLQVRKIPGKELNSKIDELLEILELKKVQNIKIQNLSGGQKQRVAIGRSLAVEPKVLLMDEPLSAVDERLRDDLRVLIRRILKKKKFSAILVSHSFQDTASICDKLSFWQSEKLTEPKIVDEWISNPSKADIAEFIGYNNILPSEWLIDLIQNKNENGRKPGYSISSSMVIIPENSVELARKKHELFIKPDIQLVTTAEVIGFRWRGASRIIILNVNGKRLEIYSNGEFSEGDSLYIAIDKNNIIGIES